jgi:dihydroorotase
MAQGVVADVISSDLQGVNITGPCHSLAHVASIFLNNGFSLRDVIQRITINPARVLGLDDRVGSLTPGYPARVTVFDIVPGDHVFRDTTGQTRVGESRIVPRFCVLDGEVIDSDEAPGLDQGNWSFMPRMFGEESAAADLDPEQRDFARVLARAAERADWDDGLSVQAAYRRAVADVGIEPRKAADAVYDLLLESRFSVPPGWLMSAMERDVVLARLRDA